jgi:DNA replication protein DnaC
MSAASVVAGKGTRRCACRVADLRRRLLEQARIPKRHEACSLKSYRPAEGNASQLRAFKAAYTLVRGYPAAERGLIFAGPVGVGKTHLAVYTDERQTHAGETLQDRIGARLRSRLYEMCRTFLIDGHDFRKRFSEIA